MPNTSLEGTPLGALFDTLRSRLPAVEIERSQADDTIWDIRSDGREVGIRCHPGGRLPFLIERDTPYADWRVSRGNEERAVDLIIRLLSNS